MDIALITIAVLIVAYLIYQNWEMRSKCRGLTLSVLEMQNVQSSLGYREKERQEEFNFLYTEATGLLEDVVTGIYSGSIVIKGVGPEFKEDLAAVLQVFKFTPKNYLSSQIGEFDIDIDSSDFNGLSIIKKKAPNLSTIRYIDLILIARGMIEQKCNLTGMNHSITH